MKTRHVFIVAAIVLTSWTSAFPQVSPSERRALRQYTSSDELVSIASTTPMNKAFAAISEVTSKFLKKIIIDPQHRDDPIGVDIQGLHWRDALEAVCIKNNVWFTEFDTYIQIIGNPSQEELAGRASQVSGAATDIQKEVASAKSREVKISAIFFEVSLSRLEEVGINWSFMKTTKDVGIVSSLDAGERVSSPIFQTGIVPKLSFANIDILAKLFSSYELGEILSSPQVVVRSGMEGRIQVGQDFSIKERDFAGNLIDKFYSTGTIIRVKPQVINEQNMNFVHMDVDVERSSVVPGAVSTIINKTKANTNLLLLNGEETIIGGLYSNELSTVRLGIPLLKDLPWYVFGLRYLFGYNKDEVKKKELIILLKAELVPTLKDRVDEKAEGLYERWLEEKDRVQQRILKDK